MNEVQYSFYVPASMVNTIMEGLAELPLKRSLRIVQFLEQQILEQNKSREEAERKAKEAKEVKEDETK